jgi:hypothetical protein
MGGELHRSAGRHDAGDQDRPWVAVLPRGARPPYRVWINGVEQREGDDYVVAPDGLRFAKPLAREGQLGFWRWALIFFGIAGSYRQHDNVDVQFETDRGRQHVTGLEIRFDGDTEG